MLLLKEQMFSQPSLSTQSISECIGNTDILSDPVGRMNLVGANDMLGSSDGALDIVKASSQ